MKIKCKFEVTFDLTLKDGEKLDKRTLTDFKKQLHNFCYDWDGFFYAYHKKYDRDVIPTNVKVKNTYKTI